MKRLLQLITTILYCVSCIHYALVLLCDSTQWVYKLLKAIGLSYYYTINELSGPLLYIYFLISILICIFYTVLYKKLLAKKNILAIWSIVISIIAALLVIIYYPYAVTIYWLFALLFILQAVFAVWQYIKVRKEQQYTALW